jgi:hypothetical protein
LGPISAARPEIFKSRGMSVMNLALRVATEGEGGLTVIE